MSHEAAQRTKLELPSDRAVAWRLQVRVGRRRLAYVSGHGPVGADGTAICGRLGETLQKEAGYEAARRTASTCLRRCASISAASMQFKRFVKTTGFVNATPDFKDHPGRDQRLQRADARRVRPGRRHRGTQRDGRGVIAGRLGGRDRGDLSGRVAARRRDYAVESRLGRRFAHRREPFRLLRSM